MSIIINENYSKDGKELLQLVQEWINENIISINCISNLKEVKYKHR